MSNEARIQISLQIRQQGIAGAAGKFFQSNPTQFGADVGGPNGPSPGSLLVPTAGLDINFSQLKFPGGFCWFQNLDNTNYVEWGAFDPAIHKFYPIGELLPGELYLIRLSRWLGIEYGSGHLGTGTGSVGMGDTLRFKAAIAPCVVTICGFDK